MGGECKRGRRRKLRRSDEVVEWRRGEVVGEEWVYMGVDGRRGK